VFIITFIRPVWAGLLEVNVGLVPGPALCLGASAAERPQEILYQKYEDFQISSTLWAEKNSRNEVFSGE
jgi:hypothetical protein